MHLSARDLSRSFENREAHLGWVIGVVGTPNSETECHAAAVASAAASSAAKFAAAAAAVAVVVVAVAVDKGV